MTFTSQSIPSRTSFLTNQETATNGTRLTACPPGSPDPDLTRPRHRSEDPSSVLETVGFLYHLQFDGHDRHWLLFPLSRICLRTEWISGHIRSAARQRLPARVVYAASKCSAPRIGSIAWPRWHVRIAIAFGQWINKPLEIDRRGRRCSGVRCCDERSRTRWQRYPGAESQVRERPRCRVSRRFWRHVRLWRHQ